MTMDFGLHLPASSATVTAEDLVCFAQQAEALGFYCRTVADDVIVPKNISVPYPYTVDGKHPGTGYHLETLMTMAFLAGTTKRIRFITSVMILPYRNPIVTAKMLASLDVLSGGRVIVGAGVGWMKEEFETIRTEPFEERGKVTDEYIAAFRELWTSDNPSFSGKYCCFSPSRYRSRRFPSGSAATASKRSAVPPVSATAGIRSAACRRFRSSPKTSPGTCRCCANMRKRRDVILKTSAS